MLIKTEQSDRAPNPNGKPENCYCSALPKGSLCLPCYTRWLGRQRAGEDAKVEGTTGATALAAPADLETPAQPRKPP
jgi:hypothetical protein